MVLHRNKAFGAFFILFFTITAASCMRISGPGIMPTVEENAGGEWKVLDQSTAPVAEESGGQKTGWWIVIQYMPGEDIRRISSTDIRATFDGKPIPFTFEEEDQILRAETDTVFGPSIIHSFVLRPSVDSALSFPSFELVIP